MPPKIKKPKNPALIKLIENCQRQLVQARAQGTTATSSPNARGRKTNLDAEREGHSGRKGDILADYHHGRGDFQGKGRADGALPPLILKVSVAGSGAVVMSSQKDKKDTMLLRINDKRFDKWLLGGQDAPEAYGNDKGDIVFSGPGARTKTGPLDQGANSIDNLVKKVPSVIKAAIPEQGYDEGENVIVLMKAHSRGAVAAGIIAKTIKADYPKIKVETTLFDPVPGPSQTGKKLKNDIGEMDQSTLVYSVASGYGPSTAFTPQKLKGAKRIIIVQQVHAAGAKLGFKYGGELFKGSRLNSLAMGAYYETNVDKDGFGILAKMDWHEFEEKLQLTTDNRKSKRGVDWNRTEILRKALKEFFDRTG